MDNYLKQWTGEDSGTPRHRLTGSGTWMLPVGKGRHFMTSAPRLLDALVGGWNLAGTMTWHSGTLLNFGGMLVTGDPTISNPGPNGWFNTSVFKQLPAYTRRTNPVVLLQHQGAEVLQHRRHAEQGLLGYRENQVPVAHGRVQRAEQHELQQSEHECHQQSVRKIHGYLSAGFRPPPATWASADILAFRIRNRTSSPAGHFVACCLGGW